MIATARERALIGWVALFVTALAAANWYLEPERAGSWSVGIATMAAIWVAVASVGRVKLLCARTDSERRFVVLCALAGALLLAVSLGAALLHSLGIAGETFVQRAKGVSIGLMLMIIGNALPKIIGPLAVKHCLPAHLQADQRFAGWSFALAGLIYAVAWILVPLPQAEVVSAMSCAAALVLVIARLARRLLHI